MLHNVTLDGFRSFGDATTIEMAPLTVLAGPNNVGKSSVVQILLAFVQSEEARSAGNLLLSGPWCDLGPFEQVISASRGAGDRTFTIGMRGESGGRLPNMPVDIDVLWRFGPPNDDDGPSARVHEIEYRCEDVSGKITMGQENRALVWTEERDEKAPSDANAAAVMLHPGALISESRIRQLRRGLVKYAGGVLSPIRRTAVHAVGPFRMPPQAVYAPRMSKFGPPIGRHAEHTAELLWRNRAQRSDLVVPGNYTKSSEPQKPVLAALNDWWSYIFDGKLALHIDVPARLGYTLAIDTTSADSLGLGQVGIGLSQALPIVATAVLSTPGDLVMVETPEAHLHPGAQHRLANLLIELARQGRQVIIETHSEHIVNAVRLAVKNGFPLDSQSIQFFSQSAGNTTVEKIPLDIRGKALRWPAGFFDQATIDLAELLR